MSELTRQASDAEVIRAWPVVKGARLFTTVAEFSDFGRADPWRVRVTEFGEVIVLDRWRQHLGILAIRGLWAPKKRTRPLVEHLVQIARTRGFTQVLSPLLSSATLAPYLDAGMEVAQEIVALQGFSAEIKQGEPPVGMTVRSADASDIPAIAALDAACFDEFWRYGVPEIAQCLREHSVVACDETGAVAGYSTCSLYGGTAMLARLAVAPGSRRRGVGRLLVSDAGRWASGNGAFALTLCTQEHNTVSRALYGSISMHELPERYALAMLDV